MMDLKYIDSRQPIVPDKSLGGILLRANIGDYARDILSIVARSAEPTEHSIGILDAWYVLRPCHIAICVRVTNGQIIEITALDGYEGTLFGQIRVGMTAGEALALASDLYYDTKEDGLLSTVHKGLALGLPERDPADEVIPSLRISSISIFAPEIGFWTGDSGQWDLQEWEHRRRQADGTESGRL